MLATMTGHKKSEARRKLPKDSSNEPSSSDNSPSSWLSKEAIIPNRVAVLFVVIASFATRLYNLHEPAHVCWDETHFGKMASWYINRTFFFDVHPPLGKMMIALSGRLTGYDGKFAFDKPGDEYHHYSQYLGMRIFCATLGLAIPIMIFRAVKSMTSSIQAAFISAIFITFDNGMVTLTRYILLDSPLLFFISSSILGMAEFSFRLPRQKSPDPSFTPIWWFWLVWQGVSIASAFSVKFVGLFIVALIGLKTVHDIWMILGDTSQTIMYFFRHFTARVICLILLPITLYTAFFYVHLELLNHTGSGDGFYSSSFQSRLIGNSLHNSTWPAHLAYGAEVTIKNNRIGGAYLHSHWHLYPEGVGAKQQQVTAYSHKDSNNKWLIKRGFHDQSSSDILVRDGDYIRLEHVVTKRNLHSHFEPAPLTKRHYQVTCYGENGTGDANDIWIIRKQSELINRQQEDSDRIETVKTRFRLIHYLSNCALHSHSKHLPKWAYEQLEVTCNPRLFDRNNYWNIEDNYYPHLPNVSFEEYAPSFIERFVESHAVMLQGNAGLKPKEGEVTSRPWQWPINYRGQFFSVSKNHKIYLLGNPVVWWANILTVPVSLLIIFSIAIADRIKQGPSSRKRIDEQKVDLSHGDGIEANYLKASSWTLLGWALHYVPFYFMGRVLYFHHYFPAFIFSSMLTAMTTSYIFILMGSMLKLKPEQVLRRAAESSVIILGIVVYTYAKFIPLTYGTKLDTVTDNSTSSEENWRSEQQLSSLKWLDSWEF